MKEVSSLKGAKKDIVVLFVIFIAVVILIKGTEFQTVDEYYLTHIDDISENSKTVTFSINCEKALEKSEFLNDRQRKLIGDGIILEPTEYVLRDVICLAGSQGIIKFRWNIKDRIKIFTTVFIFRGLITCTNLIAERRPGGYIL